MGDFRINHMSAKTTSKCSLHSSNRVATALATQQPGGEVIAARTVRAANTCLKNWTTDTAALKENFSSMMPTKMEFRAAILAEWAALTPEGVEPFYSSISYRIQDMITAQGSHTKH